MKLPSLLENPASQPLQPGGWPGFEMTRLAEIGAVADGQLTDHGRQLLEAVRSKPWADFEAGLSPEDRKAVAFEAQIEVAQYIARGCKPPTDEHCGTMPPERFREKCVVRGGVAWLYRTRDWPGVLPPAEGGTTLLWDAMAPAAGLPELDGCARIVAGDIWRPLIVAPHPGGLKYTIPDAGC